MVGSQLSVSYFDFKIFEDLTCQPIRSVSIYLKLPTDFYLNFCRFFPFV